MMIKKALEKTEEAIKNGQSRDNANIGHNFQQYFFVADSFIDKVTRRKPQIMSCYCKNLSFWVSCIRNTLTQKEIKLMT